MQRHILYAIYINRHNWYVCELCMHTQVHGISSIYLGTILRFLYSFYSKPSQTCVFSWRCFLKQLLETVLRTKKLLQRYLEHLQFCLRSRSLGPHHLVLKADFLWYELLNRKRLLVFAKRFFLLVTVYMPCIICQWLANTKARKVEKIDNCLPKVCDERNSPLHQCLPPVLLLRELLALTKTSEGGNTRWRGDFGKRPSPCFSDFLWMPPLIWDSTLTPDKSQKITSSKFRRAKKAEAVLPLFLLLTWCDNRVENNQATGPAPVDAGRCIDFFKVSLTSRSIVCGPSSYMQLPASWWLVRWQVTCHKIRDSASRMSLRNHIFFFWICEHWWSKQWDDEGLCLQITYYLYIWTRANAMNLRLFRHTVGTHP